MSWSDVFVELQWRFRPYLDVAGAVLLLGVLFTASYVVCWVFNEIKEAKGD